MLNRNHVLGISLVLLISVVTGYADQPRMTAARTDLLQARSQLQGATRNKGGHRAKAIDLINSAIVEVNAGIRFDRNNNHTQPVAMTRDQPHMERALANLRSAKSNLEAASNDKGGHRVNALRFVNEAIDEVKRGIDAGE